MAALLLLVAIIGGVLVGDLVLENTAAGSAAVLHHPITGSTRAGCWPWRPRSGSSLACW